MSEPATSPRVSIDDGIKACDRALGIIQDLGRSDYGLTPLQRLVWESQIADLRKMSIMLVCAALPSAFVLGFAVARLWFGS